MNAPENNSGRFARQNDIRLCVLFYHIKGKMSRKKPPVGAGGIFQLFIGGTYNELHLYFKVFNFKCQEVEQMLQYI